MVAEKSAVESHYGRQGLGEIVLRALAAAGKDVENLTPADLAPIDEFHVRGRQATSELAARIGLTPNDRVLDVGSGLGGPSRLLAAEYGCKVTGLDLTADYCRVAQMLAEKLGLGGLVDYRQGDALALPFDDGQFDVVWSQHAAMNIADKARLYSEMARVVKSGGTVAIYDVLAGSGGPVIFPVPWATGPALSFLAEPAEWRRLLEGRGLEVIHWRDTTALGRQSFRAVVERNRKKGLGPLGLHVVMGTGFAEMTENQLLNLEQDRVVLIETVCRKR